MRAKAQNGGLRSLGPAIRPYSGEVTILLFHLWSLWCCVLCPSAFRGAQSGLSVLRLMFPGQMILKSLSWICSDSAFPIRSDSCQGLLVYWLQSSHLEVHVHCLTVEICGLGTFLGQSFCCLLYLLCCLAVFKICFGYDVKLTIF